MQANRQTNADRSRTTRAALTGAARKLFIEKGFAETSTPQIVKEAGVTRGALYHHFADKTELFEAVLEGEAAAIAADIDAKTDTGMSAFDNLVLGGEAYLDAMAEPGRAQLLLLDGPAILGSETVAGVHARHGDAQLQEGLAFAIKQGAMPDLPLGPLTQIFSAMFDRAAVAIAAGEPAADYKQALRGLISQMVVR
ncbi:MAG: TetR/AcrR family transcriptional regulator [Hyphomicrobiales bacterium]